MDDILVDVIDYNISYGIIFEGSERTLDFKL